MNYKVKLNHINTFIFDVDGVLTNGNILINGKDYQRTINVKDSYAVQYAAKIGYKIFLITGGESECLKNTFLRLGVTEVRLESSNKLHVFEGIKNQYNLELSGCLYMGDDIPDIPLLKIVGLPVAPQDACIDVKNVANYVSPYPGGSGCVRDVIEQTLRVQGKWLGPDAYIW